MNVKRKGKQMKVEMNLPDLPNDVARTYGGGLCRFYEVIYSINSKKKKFELNPEEDLQCLKGII